jgi:flagellar protein FliS
MNSLAQLERYKTVQVRTSSPGEILVMLYEGLLRFLEDARSAMERNDRARAGERIGKSHAILVHLLSTLDRSHAPELAENLDALYHFAMGRITEANLKQDSKLIEEAMRVIRPLLEGFATIVRGAGAGAP